MPVLATRNPTDKPIRAHLYNKQWPWVLRFHGLCYLFWWVFGEKKYRKCVKPAASLDFKPEATTLGLVWVRRQVEADLVSPSTCGGIQPVGTARMGVVLGHWLRRVSLGVHFYLYKFLCCCLNCISGKSMGNVYYR